MTVRLINNAGMELECPVGFSWTTLLFGFFVPLLRGDLIGMLIHILGSLFTVGFFWLIWPFFYNKNYINRLLEKGYIPYSNKDLSILKDSGIVVNKVYDSGNHSEKHGQNGSSEIIQQESDELGINAALISSFDLTNQISLAWPVAPLTGSLMKSLTKSGEEKIACYFDYQNVQHRKILYTQWEIKCFDIIKKPILTEIPVIIRHENTLEPGETVKVVSSGTLPQGTRLFIPYLQAVLYADQTVEEFPENEILTDIKPRMRISELENYSESGLAQYQESYGLANIPQYVFEKINEGIWTCAYCGTRNSSDSSECRLCSNPQAQCITYSSESLSQFFSIFQSQQQEIAEERRRQEEEEKRLRAEQEKKDREDREEKRRVELIEEKRAAKRLTVITIIMIALSILAAMSWFSIFKPMEDYKKATMFFEQGQYFDAFVAYKALGDYQDSGAQSLNAYLKYLETDAPENTRLIGYQRLLDNSVPKEAVFASYFKFLESVTDLDVLLEGYRWLESKGYENAKESIYALAGRMVIDGRYLDAHGIFSSLGEYKDARNKAAELTRKVVYNTQGADTDVLPHIVVYGEKVVEPAPPIKEGYAFAGWYKDRAFTKQWDFAVDIVLSNVVLYAKWFGPVQIGGQGLAGGFVFYDKGIYSDGWRYLEAAPVEYEYRATIWGGTGYTKVGETSTEIGKGESNTYKIVAKFGDYEPYRKKADYAAKVCADLEVFKDGKLYDDWFLPSKDELNEMYINLKRKNLGEFSRGNYWSSSEAGIFPAWGQGFISGNQYNLGSGRDSEAKVRPIRAF